MLPSFPTETFPVMAAWVEGLDFTTVYVFTVFYVLK